MVAHVDTRIGAGVGRSVALDAIRGLAIVLMIGDHLALVAGDGQWYRFTLGRLAMPLFFVLAGHLAGRITRRHGWIVLLGLILPVLVPWIDSPNVLVLWAAGCVVLWLSRFCGLHPLWLAAIALGVAANNWGVGTSTSYEVLSLWGLMALGASISRDAMARAGSVLPAWLAGPGRRPILIYVGHVLLLAGVASWMASVSAA